VKLREAWRALRSSVRSAPMIAGLACAILSATASAGDSPSDGVYLHPATVTQLKDLLAPAQAALTQSQALRGHFEQQKFLMGVPGPLKSDGEFTFARDRGIWWHTVKPFDSELVLTRAGIVERDAGGTALSLSADQQPALRVVADVFLSLFALDPQLLAENFQTYGTHDAAGWVLGLVPKTGALGGAISKVAIHGGARVERVELTDQHGDRTELTLSDDGRGGGPLSSAEAARFDAKPGKAGS